jgi:CheY-like chemotaxis protein
MKILYAEDNEMVRTSFERLLKLRGYAIESVENGVDLLAKLQSNEKYDVVITDNNMPLMSGFEALKAIRKESRFQSMPVIVLTADWIKEDVQKLGALYIDKGGPKTFDLVFDALKNIQAKAA